MDKSSRSLKNLSFILYDEAKAPSYFEVNRPLLRRMLIVLPLIAFITSLTLLVVAVYFKSISLQAERREPEIITELRAQNMELTETIDKLKEDSKKFEDRLAKGSGESDLMPLNLFKAAAGMQDLSNNPTFALENFEAEAINKKVEIKFNIVNTTKDNERISGFIFVAMKAGDSIQIYPRGSFTQNELSITYNRGESFMTSRFRPVEVAFPLIDDSKEALIQVIIFSRTGDILHKKIFSKSFNY